ncbi:MAG: sulfurtransferase-like selenium metabolism protein YedF [Desulfuromonadales bacterium]|nr:sulfurtransferase-like selenium metabolism protein YedF [Desulfuromonadales bacterium]
METIDCRNLACPAPVITVKKALQGHREIRILLDDGAPRENVARFSRNRGCQVTEEPDGAGWVLTITAPPGAMQPAHHAGLPGDRVLLITSDRLGDGPDELGRLLMKSFIHTLLETDELPSRMLFVNTGVFLPCADSDTFEALTKLHGMGIEIFSCGLCLDFFNLKEKQRAGGITNMLSIAEYLLKSGLVIRL